VAALAREYPGVREFPDARDEELFDFGRLNVGVFLGMMVLLPGFSRTCGHSIDSINDG
jgi:hypothetical protein